MLNRGLSKLRLDCIDKRMERGVALITLLFFMIIAMTVTSAAVIMILINSLSGMKLQEGEIAYHIARSGGENAVLRLLRNPSYSGETLAVGGGTAVITVTGSGPYTILSEGRNGNFLRRVEITADYVNNLLTVTSQREVF